MRAPSPALPAFEIPVGGRGAALARTEDVVVHAETHGAAGIAPLEAGLGEDAIEPFPLRLSLDPPRAGHDHRAHAAGHLSALRHFGGFAQIFDPRVGAGPEEYAVDLEAFERRAGPKAHVLERALDTTAARPRDAASAGSGTRLGDLGGHPRTGAPGDLGTQRGGIDLDGRVVGGPGVAVELLPLAPGALPGRAGAARADGPQVGEGGRVRSHHAGAGAGLDGHVADRHPAFHGQRPDGRRRCTR